MRRVQDDNGTGGSAARAGAVSAGLLVQTVRIRGFRNLVDVEIQLEETTTYLVGENNSGKSSVLMAIATACGHRRPVDDDLHRAAPRSTSSVATIDLLIRSSSDAFPDEVAQRLGGLETGQGPGPGEWTGIRSTLNSSREGTFLPMRRTFLRWDPLTADWGEYGFVPERVSELLQARLLSASRDLTADFSSPSSDWSRVLSDLGITTADRSALEGDLGNLAIRLREASPIVDSLQRRLSRAAQAQSGVDSIELVPIPTNIEELARSVDVVVASGGRTGLPLRFQGLGSRSIASIMVFHAMCEHRVGRDLGIEPHMLALIEEPEAHLHPQAQAAVGRLQ